MFVGLRAMLQDREGKILLVAAIGLISFGTLAYTRLEGWSPIDALYFSVVALATVGFGDLVPTTDLGKLFTVGYILFGVGILAGFVSELTKDRRAVIARRMAAYRPTEHEPPGIGPEA
jgi:voltage-gated potassium channel